MAGWRLQRDALELPAGALHVWLAELDIPEDIYWPRLSPAERERASLLRFQRLRRRFAVAHGFLRDVLKCYTGVDPDFATGEYGKPELAGGTGLRFNLSHSENLAVLAVIRDRRVGVDVELYRPIPERDSLAARYFTAREREFSKVSEPAFFTCWTRKEAYIKALGGGLSIPLTSFDTSMPIPGWLVEDLPLVPGGTGAVALEGEELPSCSFFAMDWLARS